MVEEGDNTAAAAAPAAAPAADNENENENENENGTGGTGGVITRTRGVGYTVSLAVCSSMVDNCQSMELATVMAGQVARCAGIFCADEVVVVDDYPNTTTNNNSKGKGVVSACAAFLARQLQYVETPQYLRRHLVPSHPHLKHVGLLPPLNAPHHPKSTEWTKYREGVVIQEQASTSPSEETKTDNSNNNTAGNANAAAAAAAAGGGGDSHVKVSLVDCGLERPVAVHKSLKRKERVTIRMKEKGFLEESDAKKRQQRYYRGKLVSSGEPRQRKGMFWGYRVRIAKGIHEALHEGPYEEEGGYDLKIGTSERGQVFDPSKGSELPPFKHLIVAFGAVDGLEFACKNDCNVGEVGKKDPSNLFDMYLNTCPAQGTRTIRAEEAMVISMSLLATKFPTFFSSQSHFAGGGGGD